MARENAAMKAVKSVARNIAQGKAPMPAAPMAAPVAPIQQLKVDGKLRDVAPLLGAYAEYLESPSTPFTIPGHKQR